MTFRQTHLDTNMTTSHHIYLSKLQYQRDFDGHGETPIYIALKGEIFDVSSAREFYGEGSK